MPLDRSTSLGLNTDWPPDRLGDQAFRLQNVMPASPTSVRPRQGVEEIERYESRILGRQIIVDALPEDLGNGVMVTCVNTTSDGDGGVDTQVDGIGIFRPRLLASQYSDVTGLNLSQVLFGVVQ